jgi:hypothetical protein
MFFTHMARLVAILALVLGTFQVLLGFGIATEFVGPYDAALARYTNKSSAGQVIDRGMYVIIFALALGTLAEISYSVSKRSIQVSSLGKGQGRNPGAGGSPSPND